MLEQTYGEVCAQRDGLRKELTNTLESLLAAKEELDAARTIARAGGLYIGQQDRTGLTPDLRGDLYLFNSPKTRTTLAVWQSDCDVETIRTMLHVSDAAFGLSSVEKE